MLRRAAAIAASAFLFYAPLASADDWRAWRGPLGTGQSDTGQSTEQGLPAAWSPTENIRWKVPLDGPGNGSPIVVGQRVFLTHSPAGSTARGLYCFDRAKGELLWKHQVEYAEDEPTHNTNPFCSASPVSDGERVIAWYGSAGLLCYDLAGNVQWQKDLGQVRHIWGYGASPILHDDLVILSFGPGLTSYVVALDKRTGNEIWRKEYPGQKSDKLEEYRGSWSTPVVHKFGERTLLLLSLPETLRAVDPRTGDDVWTCGGLSKLVYASPLVAGDTVVAMCGYGGPALAVKATGTGDVTDERLWIHPKNPQRVGSGVVVGDHVYILNEPGIAWCLDPQTGEHKWEQRLGGGNSWSSMTHVGGRIYISNTAGTTFVLDPSPEACQVVAENKLGETIRATPAYSDGQIFIRTYKHLVCIQQQAREQQGTETK
jgi:outer membrane protein assembly factor BamB